MTREQQLEVALREALALIETLWRDNNDPIVTETEFGAVLFHIDAALAMPSTPPPVSRAVL